MIIVVCMQLAFHGMCACMQVMHLSLPYRLTMSPRVSAAGVPRRLKGLRCTSCSEPGAAAGKEKGACCAAAGW